MSEDHRRGRLTGEFGLLRDLRMHARNLSAAGDERAESFESLVAQIIQQFELNEVTGRPRSELIKSLRLTHLNLRNQLLQQGKLAPAEVKMNVEGPLSTTVTSELLSRIREICSQFQSSEPTSVRILQLLVQAHRLLHIDRVAQVFIVRCLERMELDIQQMEIQLGQELPGSD